MVNVLGKKRITILLVLLLLNVGGGAFAYLYLMPERVKVDQNLGQMSQKTSVLRSDISRMQIAFDELAVQKEEFEAIEKKGFFETQNRDKITLILKKIETESGVVSAVARISAGTVLVDDEAAKAGHYILKSPISIEVEALDDVDVYKYLYLLESFFPGHLSLTGMALERNSEVTSTVIRSIASGASPGLVSAKIDFSWQTMIHKSKAVAPKGGQL